MPDSSQERTEDASPKRKSDARKKGQVARSAELPGALALVAGVVVLRAVGPAVWGNFSALMVTDLSQISRPDLTPQQADTLVTQSFAAAALAVAPLFLALLATGLAAGLAQTGMVVSTKTLTPKFDRLNPMSGFKRIFSINTGFELLKMSVRLAVLVAAAFGVLGSVAGQVLTLAQVGLPAAPAMLGDTLFAVVLRVALAGAFLAVVDYAYQRWRFSKTLKMTKQEVREEQHQLDGNPQIKARIRRVQRELARRRMMQEVTKATAVVVNPTHVAVALRYLPGKARAPIVVAKGQDLIALQIKEVARRHGVPVVENPPLARALHAGVPLGREIPANLYRAVAEVLAFVYKLKRRW